MAAPYIRLDDNWNRPSKPPTKAAVAGWPFPQYAQKSDIYNIDGRRSKAPETAEVSNWPYPQYSQQEPKPDLLSNYEHRKNTAPTKAEVAGWPYPQYSKGDVITSQNPTGQEWNNGRSMDAPTKPEVRGWPGPGQTLSHNSDIAKNEHINQDVYEATNPMVPSTNEWKRSATAPKSAGVANWPYPQYAQANLELPAEFGGAPAKAGKNDEAKSILEEGQRTGPVPYSMPVFDTPLVGHRPATPYQGPHFGYSNPDFHRKYLNDTVYSYSAAQV